MRERDYFPLGVAKGLAFCNRESETEILIDNLKNSKHTLLMATRRYGKSSLALHSLHLCGLPYVEIDFYMASNERVVAAIPGQPKKALYNEKNIPNNELSHKK